MSKPPEKVSPDEALRRIDTFISELDAGWEREGTAWGSELLSLMREFRQAASGEPPDRQLVLEAQAKLKEFLSQPKMKGLSPFLTYVDSVANSYGKPMHACPLRMTEWEPESPREEWLSQVVSRNPELRKCVLDCGPLQTRGAALSIAGQAVYVHIESTVCEHCGTSVGPCAVPDFGAGGDSYREFVLQQPRQRCPSCNKRLERRIVLRRLA
jgi:hypothetical protein